MIICTAIRHGAAVFVLVVAGNVAAQCLEFSKVGDGWHSGFPALKMNGYDIWSLTSPRGVNIRTEPLRPTGSIHGIHAPEDPFIMPKELYETYYFAFAAYQNGPLKIVLYDKAGKYVSRSYYGPNHPQAELRYGAFHHPGGIGMIQPWGSTDAIMEGVVSRVCPLGKSLGPNPLKPSDIKPTSKGLGGGGPDDVFLATGASLSLVGIVAKYTATDICQDNTTHLLMYRGGVARLHTKKKPVRDLLDQVAGSRQRLVVIGDVVLGAECESLDISEAYQLQRK
mgnify:CR=1 FL=1|jgi:hypothetical protein